MPLERENLKPEHETSEVAALHFDENVISLIPSLNDQNGLRDMLRQEQDELRSGKLKQRMIDVLGREVSPTETNELFSFPNKQMTGQTLMCTGENERQLETSTILCDRQGPETKYAGIVNLAFRNHAYPYLFIRRRELETTGEQIGLEIQCRLEKFCRDNNIWKIHNEALSEPENYLRLGNSQKIGAYVWARCGFEFANSADALGVLEKFSEYKIHNGIKPLQKLTGFGTAIEYAKMEGVDKEGNTVPLGKNFFLNSRVLWNGVRDLRPDSQSTQIFIEYLKEKGREDLIEKYLSDPKTEPEEQKVS